MQKVFQNEHVSCVVTFLPNRMLAISGTVDDAKRYERMYLIAAHPIQQMTSYSGSGLPWSCPNMAMDNTPNFFEIPPSGNFTVNFSFPNSYYMNDGIQRVLPSLFVVLTPKNGEPISVQFQLPEDDPLPLRTLTHREGRASGSDFYNAKDTLLGVPSSAEKTMRAYKDYKIAYDKA